ncbi:MAG: peptide chain release factor N(5)-glutamine methyltransferase, partial [Dehalococcoidia bacterium]|nr:peptide chain release factor N(5)-glutamine methyltransferase [Dehalococcoidia bacterium]
MRLREAWARSRRQLERASIPDADIEAQVLLRNTLGIDRATFHASLDRELSDEDAEAFERSVQRRIEGEPLSYITGHREFYGLDFVVTPDVLVPRQETELLVEAVLEYARSRGGDEDAISIADIGTGSGCVAVALGAHMSNATVYATDVSEGALCVAGENVRRHGLDGRVRLRHGDLFEALDGPVDVVVSNPPYLSEEEAVDLPLDVQREPRVALVAGSDGMDVLLRLIVGAREYVKPGGLLALEIDPRRVEAVERLARGTFPGGEIGVIKAHAGLER